MDPKPRSSSSAALDPGARTKRDETIRTFVIRSALAASPFTGDRARAEAATADIYHRRYTVPILEATGLLDAEDDDEAIHWGAIQLLLGLSLRHHDNVLDSQATPDDVPIEARQAQAYLDEAQRRLHEHASGWTPRHAALHRQFLDYECEARAGDVHDLSTLWRRASPLCVLPEIDLAARLRDPRLKGLHRRHISVSLLLADCDHAWKDLANGPETPVTRLIAESRTRSSLDFDAAANRLGWIRSFGARERAALAQAVEAAGCKRWADLLVADAQFALPNSATTAL